MAPVIDAYAKPIFEQARRAGLRDSIEAYRADAVLAALAAAGTLVGLDVTALPRRRDRGHCGEPPSRPSEPDGRDGAGRPAAGAAEQDQGQRVDPHRRHRAQAGLCHRHETCEIVGVGPVDVAWVQQLLPDALVDVLLHDLVDIQAHATITRHRKRAVESRAREPATEDASSPAANAEATSRSTTATTSTIDGPTSGANCERLCEVHHDEKTHRGARIVRTATEWHWYPPPPKPGEPEPPPGSIPWQAPIGEHLNPFDLTDLPPPDPGRDQPEPDDTLPFEPPADGGTACGPASD